MESGIGLKARVSSVTEDRGIRGQGCTFRAKSSEVYWFLVELTMLSGKVILA